MDVRSEQGLFGALERELKKATEPLDCATLFDKPAVRKHAASVNRVSDYLGNLWRKGLVLRLPAPRLEGTRARWLYVWKGRPPPKAPDMSEAIEFDPSVQTVLTRARMEITEEGDSIVITLPAITITVKHTGTTD
jgi:hypothetical protein